MRKPAFAYFYGLCILILFSLMTITVRGVSNKQCLLPFSFFSCPSDLSLQSNCPFQSFSFSLYCKPMEACEQNIS